jgi:uncharacterized protein YidB (DUF937 family)
MSLLDELAGSLGSSSGVSQEQHSALAMAALQMFGHSGGLTNLVQSFESNGLGDVAHSWIGNGPNQPVAPHQVESALGQEVVQKLASRAAIDPALASVALSRILPVMVDRLTPDGKLPKAA